MTGLLNLTALVAIFWPMAILANSNGGIEVDPSKLNIIVRTFETIKQEILSTTRYKIKEYMLPMVLT